MKQRKPVVEVMDDAQADIYRKMTSDQRLAIAFGMWDFAHDMIKANLTREHPDWTAEQIQLETGRRLALGGNS